MSGHNGGPAFPVQRVTDNEGDVTQWESEGMSLRDYLAARFITAQFDDSDPVKLAKKAYEVADAMLQAREVAR